MRCSDCGARIPDEYLEGDSFRCPECGRLYRRVSGSNRDVRRREPERRQEDAPDDVYADREVLRPTRERYAERGLPPENMSAGDMPSEEDMPPEEYGADDSVPFTVRATDFLTRRVWKFPMWLLFVAALIIILVVIFAISGLSHGNNDKTSIITVTATPAPTAEVIETVAPTAAATVAPLVTDAPPADVATPAKIYTDVKVPAGSYTVGDKVQAGSYSMRCSSEAGTSSVVSIYPDKNTQTTSNIYTMTASNANISRIDLVDGNVLKIEGSDVYFSTYQ